MWGIQVCYVRTSYKNFIEVIIIDTSGAKELVIFYVTTMVLYSIEALALGCKNTGCAHASDNFMRAISCRSSSLARIAK